MDHNKRNDWLIHAWPCGHEVQPDDIARCMRCYQTPTDDELRDFTAGYIECGLWADLDTGNPDEMGAGSDWPDYVDEISDDARAEITRECREFMAYNLRDLREYCDQLGDFRGDDGSTPAAMARAGHDFWLTRNEHGAGFWDRGLGALGDRLTAASKPYGNASLYVGNDGKIYTA